MTPIPAEDVIMIGRVEEYVYITGSLGYCSYFWNKNHHMTSRSIEDVIIVGRVQDYLNIPYSLDVEGH